MKITVSCRTRFDITATGIRGHFRSGQLPFQDNEGNLIRDNVSWTRSRNQQRNWETVNQIISLRCLPENITLPKRSLEQDRAVWSFRFEIPDPASIARDDDAVALLHTDCKDVPMITGLDEDTGVGAYLVPGPGGNIEFQLESDK
jgi:hypothetical protein